jgi:ribosome-associated toxin RatA of RatAB toxin-antitoxin module
MLPSMYMPNGGQIQDGRQKICHIEFFVHFEFLGKKFFLQKMDNKPNLIRLKVV